MHLADKGVSTVISQKAHQEVTIAVIRQVYKLLKQSLHHTPLTPSRTLRDMTGADIYRKAPEDCLL